MLKLDVKAGLHGSMSIADCIERLEGMVNDLKAIESLGTREIVEPVEQGVIKMPQKEGE